MRVDFHLHSERSDGVLSPSRLAELAVDRRLAAWACTDHDTLAGSRELADRPGLVAGVEVTTWAEEREVHIVGLGVDRDDPDFESFLARIRTARCARLQAIIEHLAHTGLPRLELSQVVPRACLTPTRVHLAQALVDLGVAHAIGALFTNGPLGDQALAGLGPPAYPAPAAAAAAIRSAGGVALLAHPARYQDEALVLRLLEAPLDGLEVRHPNCSPSAQAFLDRVAGERGLLVSCGTDLHFPGRRRPGDHSLPRERLVPLLERIAPQVLAAA